jgi:small subunit ribosomal protein S6
LRQHGLSPPPTYRYPLPPPMAEEAREYELVLLIDPGLEDAARDSLADEVRKRIESDGNLKHADSWGLRKLAYEIRQRTEADYRFYRFEANNDLLEQLDHTLKITDGVLRFRIFKVDATTPVIVPPPAMQPARAGRDGRDAGRRPRRGRGADEGPSAAEAQAEEVASEEPEAEAAAPPPEAEPAAEPEPAAPEGDQPAPAPEEGGEQDEPPAG